MRAARQGGNWRYVNAASRFEGRAAVVEKRTESEKDAYSEFTTRCMYLIVSRSFFMVRFSLHQLANNWSKV